MRFWMIWKALFRFFCFSSKFPKLFSKRLNQNSMHPKETDENRWITDAESQMSVEKNKCHVMKESIYLDRHYLIKEKEDETNKKPLVNKQCAYAIIDAPDEPAESVEKRDDSSRCVHKAIELFNKPNDIETSLPRYQNKVAQIPKKIRHDEGRHNTLPNKMEKLKEQLQEKLSLRLQKCQSERDFCSHQDINASNKKTSEDKTEVKKIIRSNSESIEGNTVQSLKIYREKLESKDQKSEKEKQNSLLKVNLSRMNNDKEYGSLETLKNGTTITNRKSVKSLIDVNYLSKLSKKERANTEYGGGWDCHRCGQRVYHAERMLACGNAYHNTCFSCVNCKKLLGPRTYLEAEMEIYCSQCHAKKFGLTGYGFGLGPGVLQTSP